MEAIRTIKTFLYGVAKASAIIAFILASATKQFEPGSFAAAFDHVFKLFIGGWVILAVIEGIAEAKVETKP